MTRKTNKILPLLAVIGCFWLGTADAWAATEPGSAAEAEAIATADSNTDALAVPRFVSLAVDEVNLRTGPGQRYPVKLVIKRSGVPVEIIREFDVWRQVRDIDGDEGWVHKSMLSGRRSIVVKSQVQTMLRKPADDARPVAKLEPGVVARLQHCKSGWCNVSVGSYDGWIKKDFVWGVYPDEVFKE